MRIDRDEDVEVAARPALRPGVAFARQTDARAVIDAGGDADLQGALAADLTGAVAFLARVEHEAP